MKQSNPSSSKKAKSGAKNAEDPNLVIFPNTVNKDESRATKHAKPARTVDKDKPSQIPVNKHKK